MKKYLLPRCNHISSRLLFLAFLLIPILTQAATKTAVSGGNWNVASRWSPSGIPTASDDVVIPAGIQVYALNTHNAATITINGTLLIPDHNAQTNITARWIMVSGSSAKFIAGTSANTLNQKLVITLTGNNQSENVMGGGSKFLMAMNGGTIELHGQPRVSWKRLGATADVGDTSITLSGAVNWQVGDEIVIAPSGLHPNSANGATEAEVRTITAKSGSTLTLDSALNYRHYGGAPMNYSGGGKSWTLDHRAEVGSLTRTIVIQGDANSANTGFGGHVMIMEGSGGVAGKAKISRVEFFRMGQKGRLGRYPMHWHMLAGGGSGNYLRYSSIHKSFNRAVTIHGTHSTQVINNVCYDHFGHGIFLEDGSERNNAIRDNLVIETKRPAPGDELLNTDNQFNEKQNRSPAAFWITNPDNQFINNIVAGTQGTGYWFALHVAPTGASATDPRFTGMKPSELPLDTFRGNDAHSTMNGFDVNDTVKASGVFQKNGPWKNDGPHYIEDSTFYANDVALYGGVGEWRDNVVYDNLTMSDNRDFYFIASYHTLQNSLLVAKATSDIVPNNVARYAYQAYDGAAHMKDSHFVGFNSTSNPVTSLIRNIGGSKNNPNRELSGLTFNHSGTPRVVLPDFTIAPDYAKFTNAHPRNFGSVWADLDGSVDGAAGHSIIGNHPFMDTGVRTQPSNWVRAFLTADQFGQIIFSYNLSPAAKPFADFDRMHDTIADKNLRWEWAKNTFQQIPVIVNGNFTYRVTYDNLPSSKTIHVEYSDVYAGDEVLVRFKNNLGGKAGLNVTGMTQQTSLSSLKNASSNSYYAETSGSQDLWLKLVGGIRNVGIGTYIETFTITWN